MIDASPLKWHENAALKDGSMGCVTAPQAFDAPPQSVCNPAIPLVAIPAFFSGLSAGYLPCIATNAPNTTGPLGDFRTLTGGTTGQPKIIHRTSASWRHSIIEMARILSITPNSQIAVLGDLTYSLTLYAIIEGLTLGATVHCLKGLTRHAQMGAMAKRQITHLYTTPTQIRLLPDQVNKTLTHLILGGGPSDSNTFDRCKRLFPNAKLFQFYGTAETSFVAISDKNTPNGSVGKPFKDVLIRTNNTQEIDIKTPMMCQTVSTSNSKVEIPKNSWFRLADLGELDGEYLFLKGRSDRCITIADQTISLDAIEEKLRLHPMINEAAAFAVPNHLRGHEIHIVVQSDGIGVKDIQRQLTPIERAKKLIISSTWPLLPSGKPDSKKIFAKLEERQ